jgi:hypothetical protein
VEEPIKAHFIVALGSPLACTHPFLQRIRDHSQPMDCFLADEPAEEPTQVSASLFLGMILKLSQIEGLWSIFNTGESGYHGEVALAAFQYFAWADPAEAFPSRESTFAVSTPQLYHVEWNLQDQKPYQGFGLRSDGHLCSTWNPSTESENSPGIAIYRLSGPSNALDGFWWNPDGFGMEELTRIPTDSPLSHSFAGTYASVRTVDSVEGGVSHYGTLQVDYDSISDSFQLFWAIKGAGTFTGRGVLSQSHLCVGWRGKREEGASP